MSDVLFTAMPLSTLLNICVSHRSSSTARSSSPSDRSADVRMRRRIERLDMRLLGPEKSPAEAHDT